MPFELTINFRDLEDLYTHLTEFLPRETAAGVQMLDAMMLEDLLLYTDERCHREGYAMDVRKLEEPAPDEDVPEPPPAEKKTRAKAKLKEDLQASVTILEAKKGNGHQAPETDDDRKKRCVDKLQEWFYAGHKDEVRKLLKQYGDGAKSFQAVAVERFAEIDQAMQELKL